MIRIRIDDFPQTKGEPQHSLPAFREFHRELMALTNRRYLLGVIPGRCTVDDVLMLRRETDCVIGMHGVDHDEAKLDLYGNEFPSYLSQANVAERLMEAALGLQSGIGRPVRVYMPPRNIIDTRTANCLHSCGFDWFTAGPETDDWIMGHDRRAIVSLPPYEYGRTDELLQREAHHRLMEKSDGGRDVVLALHWTWETNVGLHHMREFLSMIPGKYFQDFDA